MKIVTLNLNGLRSATSHGFIQWLPRQNADIVCVQELKAQLRDLTETMRAPDNYHGYFHCADKKGYSGVGLYSRREPDNLIEGIGIPEIDLEGRFIRADFANLTVISLYLPSGSSGEHRQEMKYFFMERFFPVLQTLAESGRDVVLCGDWNIAHQIIDIKNWRSNQKNSGFLPEEAAWLSTLFDQLKCVGVFRKISRGPEQYTWWSNRGRAWLKNVGWRIDYQIATPALADTARSVSIYKNERFSDHSPLIIDYDYSL